MQLAGGTKKAPVPVRYQSSKDLKADLEAEKRRLGHELQQVEEMRRAAEQALRDAELDKVRAEEAMAEGEKEAAHRAGRGARLTGAGKSGGC